MLYDLREAMLTSLGEGVSEIVKNEPHFSYYPRPRTHRPMEIEEQYIE